MARSLTPVRYVLKLHKTHIVRQAVLLQEARQRVRPLLPAAVALVLRSPLADDDRISRLLLREADVPRPDVGHVVGEVAHFEVGLVVLLGAVDVRRVDDAFVEVGVAGVDRLRAHSFQVSACKVLNEGLHFGTWFARPASKAHESQSHDFD